MSITHAALVALSTATLSLMGVSPTIKLPASHPIMMRMASCAADVLEVTQGLPEDKREVYAPIVFVMANLESGCEANPKGSNDNGAACGPLQTHNPQNIIDGATCEKVRADRKLGLRVGLKLMLMKEAECGSVAAGLTAFAMTGVCPVDKDGKSWTLPLIKQRCKIAGLTSQCELKVAVSTGY